MSNTEFGITLKANGQAEFVGVVHTAEAALNKLGATGVNAGNEISSGADRGREGIQKITNDTDQLSAALAKVGHYGSLYFGVSQLVQYGGAVIDAQTAMDKFTSSITVASGSASNAAGEFDHVRALSNKLGLELMGTANAYASFSAAARGTSMEGQKARAVFDSVAGVAAKMSLNAEQSQGVFLALSQMMSKGVVSAEEFRQQLGERLPIATAAGAKALNVTTAEFTNLLNSGKLVSEEFLPKFAIALNEMGGGGGAVNNLQASLNRLSNNFTEIKLNIADSAPLKSITDGFVVLTSNTHLLSSAFIGVGIGGAAFAALKTGSIAKDHAVGILAQNSALIEQRAATLASAQAATAHAAAEMERTASLARSAAAASVMTGATTASRAATLAHITATEAHTVALATETAAKTAASASSGIASGALALLGGPIGWITLALGAGAAAWSLWGNSAEKSAQQAIKAVTEAKQYAAEHGLNETEVLKQRHAEALKARDALSKSGASSGQVKLADDTVWKLSAEIELAAEREKNLALRGIDSTAWDKLHQTKKERLDATLKELEQGYQKQISQLGISHEQRLAAEKTYQQRRAEIIGKGELKAPHVAAQNDPLKSGIDSIVADNSRAKMQAEGETAKNSASELKLYELAIKGIDAANKLETEGKHAAAAAMRERTAAAVQAARITTDETEKINNSIAAKKAAAKADEEAAKFIEKLNKSAKDYANSKELEKQLDGKSIVEKAGLVAQYKAELEIKQEIAKFEAMRKDNPAAADAGIAAINAAKPAAVEGAVNAAKAKATDGLVNQVEQAGGGAENDQYAKQIEAQDAYHAAMQSSAVEHSRSMQAIEKDYATKSFKMMMEGKMSQQNFAKLDEKTRQTIVIQGAESILGTMAGHNKKAFELNKAYSTGKAIISTYESVAGALAMYPGPPGWAIAGAQLAIGLAQVSAIQSASFGGGGGGGGGAPSAPPPVSNSSVPSYLPSQRGPIDPTAPLTQEQKNAISNQANITVQINALHPDAISAATMQTVADGLTPALQQAFNRNGQNVAVMV